MRVWSDLYAEAGVVPQQALKPEAVVWHGVDRDSLGLADNGCQDTVQLPFIESGSLPARAPCATGGGPDWLPGWLR
jgi:hypothetical protein